MVRQTTLEQEPENGRAPRSFVGKMAGVGHDVVAVVELQMRLLTIDLRAIAKTSALSLALAGLALALLMAALPVGLIGLGFWLASAAGWSTAAALLVVAGGTLVVAAIVAAVVWALINSQAHVLRRSADELRANVAAIKTVLADYADRDQTSNL